MPRHPRRRVLLGITSTVALATAGCLQDSDDTADDTEEDDTDAPGYDTDFETLSEFLPKTEREANRQLFAFDVKANQELDDEYGQHLFPRPNPAIEKMNVARAISLQEGSVDERLDVYAGTIEFPDEAEERETEDGRTYEFYERVPDFFEETSPQPRPKRVGAQLEGVAILASSESILEASLAAKRGDAPRLLAERPVLERGLEHHEQAASRYITTMTAIGADLFDDPDVFEFASVGIEIHSTYEIETTYVISVTDGAVLTDEVIEEITADMDEQATEEPAVEIDDTVLTATVFQDLQLRQRRDEIDSPRGLEVQPFEPGADTVPIAVTRGEETPVDELSVSIERETVDPETWAEGQETIAAGDTITLPATAVEPLTTVTLVHDHDYGSEAHESSLLSDVHVMADQEDGEIGLTYWQEVPLDGDHLHVLMFEGQRDSDDEPVATLTPWAGETITEGTRAQIEAAKPGHSFVLRWRDPADEDATIAATYTRPPGWATFEYEHETDTLTASLHLEEPRDAADFELQVDGERAGEQWSDETDVIEAEETVELEGLSIGDRVIAEFTPAGAVINRFTVPHPGSVEVTYDGRAAELELTFDLPEPQPASNYELRIMDEPIETQPADRTTTIEDGDTITIPDVPAHSFVELYWTEPEQQITYHFTEPPAKAEFDYDHETEELEVTLDLETERDPAEYELRFDTQPAPVQWTDEYETLTDGASLEIDDVAPGTDIAVRWLEPHLTVGETTAVPDITYRTEFDHEETTVTYIHEGGPALPVEELDAQAFMAEGKVGLPVSDVHDGKFAAGDSLTVDFATAEPIEDEGRDWDGAPDDMVLFDAWLAYLGEHRLPSQGVAQPDQSVVDDESVAVDSEESTDE